MIELADLTQLENLPWYVRYALDALSALVIVIVAIFASGMVKRAIMRVGFRYDHLDNTLFTFLGSFARYGILALAGIFVLQQFGIETTSLAALIGAAGLAIGLAFQGTLSNFAAGVMLLAFRPIRNGDYVTVGGHSGTVKEINIFTIELATIDNVQIIIPNSDVWSSSIVNYSAYDTRMVDLTFGVSYDTDLKLAEKVILEVVEADPRAHKQPEIWLKVANLGDFSVDFRLRVWCDRTEFWNFKNDLIGNMKRAFDENGIDIPFPTRTVISQLTE